ncbi:MAG TPA: hypothetical protein VLV50_14135 [Stellaceae bacterium]|nr:hypothetical protein [Stellaceae bacterium]
MKCFSRHVLLAVAAFVAGTVAPARADFYALEGRFQCLDRPGAVCFDATPDLAIAPPVPSDSGAPESAPAPVAAAPPPPVAAPPPPVDPVVVAARHIARNAPAAGDLDLLRRRADEGDSRALELLAWCALHGIGMSADPVAAYLLYGRAAAAGVAHAHTNQGLVYERNLSQAQRQQVLDMAATSRRATDALAARAPGEGQDGR